MANSSKGPAADAVATPDLTHGRDMANRASSLYRGDRATTYHAYQSHDAAIKGIINARKFAPWISPSDVIIDFGCAGGYTLSNLTARQKMGIEVNPHNRRVAAGIGIATVEAAEEIADCHADVVFSNHVLEHTLQPLTELRQLRRILRPGGRLVLVVPVDDWRVQRTDDPTDINHHLYTWTPLLLGNLLTEAGFRVEECAVKQYAPPGRLTRRIAPRLSARHFELLAMACAYLLRRRELRAVAVRPS